MEKQLDAIDDISRKRKTRLTNTIDRNVNSINLHNINNPISSSIHINNNLSRSLTSQPTKQGYKVFQNKSKISNQQFKEQLLEMDIEIDD